MQQSVSTESAGKTVKKTGFGSMTPERHREIASMGGRAAHEKGNGHRFNSESGRAAALKRRTMEQGAG